CLGREVDCHLVGTGRRASLAHLIGEASLAGGAGGVVIGTIVGCRRDHNPIAVDVHIDRGCPSPFETRCIYSPYLFPLSAELNGSRCRCRRRSRSWGTVSCTVSAVGV